MNEEEFEQFCRDVRSSAPGFVGPSKRMYFVGAHIGLTQPSHTPPRDDTLAEDGYILGLHCHKRLK